MGGRFQTKNPVCTHMATTFESVPMLSMEMSTISPGVRVNVSSGIIEVPACAAESFEVKASFQKNAVTGSVWRRDGCESPRECGKKRRAGQDRRWPVKYSEREGLAHRWRGWHRSGRRTP